MIKEQEHMPKKPVTIGNDSWIGTNIIILLGVHIGNRCVVGAGSDITYDVNNYSIIVGNLARIIGERK